MGLKDGWRPSVDLLPVVAKLEQGHKGNRIKTLKTRANPLKVDQILCSLQPSGAVRESPALPDGIAAYV